MTRLIIPVLLLTLVVAQPSPAAAGFAAAGFYEGDAAYKRGDFATALRELSPLANLGYAGAQYRLGVMYERGRGVPQDYKTAAKWYRRAAEQGDALAQQSLGVMYGQGQGVGFQNRCRPTGPTRQGDQHLRKQARLIHGVRHERDENPGVGPAGLRSAPGSQQMGPR